MNRWMRLTFCLMTALFCLGGGTASAASDWQVVKIGRWDYLTVDNIAKFYGFAGDLTPVNKTIRLDNGRNQLEVTLDSREAIVNGVRNWLCFPVLAQHDGKFLVSRIDLAKTIEPQFRPHMIRNLGRIKTVVLDPGHGGVEKGAGSSYGNEKDFTLDVALKLRPLLQAKGFQVVMTRQKDELVPLHERARIANATRDSIFVSIHFNATDWNASATGFEIYSLTPRGAPSTQDNALLERFLNMQAGSPVDAPSLILSTSVYHAMLGYMPEFDRGVKRARFAVLRLTSIPAILVEGGFLTERDESRFIARPEWRARLAQAIATGIDNYRGLAEKRERPMLLADYRRQIEGVLVARNPIAPGDGSARPPVFAASNQLVPSAQITQPLPHEPSQQIAISPELARAISASIPATQASPPVAEGDSARHEESEEEAAGTAAGSAESADATPVDAGEMPEGQPPDPAATQASADAPPPAKDPMSAEPSPAPVVRKYWILKFAPPPKFRE